ncbi:hypothetical protein C0992_003596 [Termitomyces sp. T32_za158]|nr:hypothetical protein C0992_003596 [Termitomyces sp. T32_za158]
MPSVPRHCAQTCKPPRVAPRPPPGPRPRAPAASRPAPAVAAIPALHQRPPPAPAAPAAHPAPPPPVLAVPLSVPAQRPLAPAARELSRRAARPALAAAAPQMRGASVPVLRAPLSLTPSQISRSSRSPFHRARASALASRSVAKAAIPITNPNSKADTPEPPDSDASPTVAPANHPSSTVAPVKAPRPTSIRPPDNEWTSLDMGGNGIKNFPPVLGLFKFSFLINLYLNHNAFTSVPPQLSKLRHLELLDLSGNLLASLPPELGMLTQLKEFYLFDNQLTTLPFEFGSLHQLRTLGVEGNPLDAALKQLIQKEGTTALISYLRDSCPVPPPPPKRLLKNLLSPAEEDALHADPATETISVLTYNILCEKYATEKLYGYTPAWALTWDYRKGLVLEELKSHETDFLCLQEVDGAAYEDYFLPHLQARGYDGFHWPKSRYKNKKDTERRQVDGCATFYKAAKCVRSRVSSHRTNTPSRYTLVEKQLIEFSAVAMQRPDFEKTDDMFNRVLVKDNIAVVCLVEDKHTHTRFIVANAHLDWDPMFSDVKLVQAALLLDEVEKIAANFARYPPPPPPPPPATHEDADAADDAPRRAPHYSDGSKIPMIICGDFNSIPDSGLYEFVSTGHLSPTHADFLGHKYGRYTTEGMRHRLGLKSVYASGAGEREAPLTNYTPTFQGSIDYVWFGSANLEVCEVLGEVDGVYLEKVVGFPNAHFPSEYVVSLFFFGFLIGVLMRGLGGVLVVMCVLRRRFGLSRRGRGRGRGRGCRRWVFRRRDAKGMLDARRSMLDARCRVMLLVRRAAPRRRGFLVLTHFLFPHFFFPFFFPFFRFFLFLHTQLQPVPVFQCRF